MTGRQTVQTGRQTDRQTEIGTDKQSDSQTEKQTDVLIELTSYKSLLQQPDSKDFI